VLNATAAKTEIQYKLDYKALTSQSNQKRWK